MMTISIKKQINQILFWQLVIILGFAMIIVLIRGLHDALSALLGGIAYWLPAVFFMLRVTKYSRARDSMQFMVAFFAGEAVKLILTAGLFVLFCKLLSLNILFTVLGLITAIIAFWFTSILSLFNQGARS